ncbi:MAG: hypothetical protein Ta2E_06800 [Mycoplasmoidaceae bacterium]|nr:MAG: hypothetical protein Ta2E_06800 [Mycoplasmoidaceae bacterium]
MKQTTRQANSNKAPGWFDAYVKQLHERLDERDRKEDERWAKQCEFNEQQNKRWNKQEKFNKICH